jgi:hypothetical protein
MRQPDRKALDNLVRSFGLTIASIAGHIDLQVPARRPRF